MNYLKAVIFTILNLALAVLIGSGLLYASFLLPTDGMEDHIKESAYTIREEGTYPLLSTSFCSTMDNWTDSIMLLEAVNNKEASVSKRAMSAYRDDISTYYNPAATLVQHYTDGEAYDPEPVSYPRYWHGFLIFLKPLLMFFNLGQIRVINGVVQALLVIITCWLFLKRKQDLFIVPWMLSYLMLMPLVLAKSLQYSSCFYVFMLGSLALILTKEEKLKNHGPFIFLNIGICLAYFDFLTYPIATFGVPMVVYLALMEGTPIKGKILAGIKNGVLWCIGYGGMWASKWILASKILGRDIVADGLSQFRERTSSIASGYHFSKVQVIIANYKEFLRTPVIYVALVCLIYLIYAIIKNRRNISTESKKSFLLYVLVGAAPLVWYSFATNHSLIHAFFTNKACVVSFISILFGMVSLATPDKTVVEETKDGEETDGQNSSTDPVLE